MWPPKKVAATKGMVMTSAEEDALVYAHHFPPFPNLGHVLKKEEG